MWSKLSSFIERLLLRLAYVFHRPLPFNNDMWWEMHIEKYTPKYTPIAWYYGLKAHVLKVNDSLDRYRDACLQKQDMIEALEKTNENWNTKYAEIFGKYLALSSDIYIWHGIPSKLESKFRAPLEKQGVNPNNIFVLSSSESPRLEIISRLPPKSS